MKLNLRKFTWIAGVMATLAFVSFGHAGTTITATRLQSDMAGDLISNGFLCLTPVNANNTPTGFTVPGGGQALPTQKCFAITSGAVSGVVVADTGLISPSGVGYQVQIQNAANQVIYTLPTPIYPTGTTWSLDSYAPTYTVPSALPAVQYLSVPPSGSCGTAPAIAYTSATSEYDCIGGVWTAHTSSIGGRMRTAMAAATQNPIGVSALSVPANWQASHAYVIGNVVANSGSYYFCYAAGTSASSGGPTTITAAQITDGTVGWYWYGYIPTYVAGTQPAPTITTATSDPSGLTNSYLNTTTLNPSLVFTGGTPVNLGAPDWSIQNANGSANPQTIDVTMSWMSDAPEIVVYGYSAAPVRLIIDGQFAYYGGFAQLFSGGEGRTVINWGTSVRKVHTYTLVESGINGGSQWFGGVKVDPLSHVWPSPSISGTRLCVFGDSTVSGSVNAPLIAGETWPFLLGQELGITDVRNLAIAGTGYIAGSGTSYPIQNAITNNLSSSSGCSAVIFSAGHNDTSSSATAIQAAALLAFQTVRGLFPNAPILVTGVWPGSTSTPSAAVTTENAIEAAVTQFGDANTYFIPEMTDTTGYWLAGNGTIAAPNGTGNADVYIASDGTHPEENGIYYYAGRLYPKIKAIFNQVP